MNKRFKAFTLAEVLITLGIIGVVAAMTMPSLNQKISDQKNMSMLRKTYSMLQQATNMVISEYESPEYWWIEDNEEEPVRIIYSYYQKYFKAMRECPNTTGCWGYPTKYLNDTVYWSAHNTSWYQYAYTLVNGVNVLIDIYPAEQISENFGMDIDYDCPVLWVDINADSSPNTIGRDIFAFIITHRGLEPAGKADYTNCSPNASEGNPGFTCTSRIIKDGWTINYMK